MSEIAPSGVAEVLSVTEVEVATSAGRLIYYITNQIALFKLRKNYQVKT